MARNRQRVCLQDGLKLDLNFLARNGFVQPGAKVGQRVIRFTHWYWGEIATGTIKADMTGKYQGWFRIQCGALDQWIDLVPKTRHFGGRQWYFVCPVKDRPVSILWKPPGGNEFRSRQAWGRQVAYQSQFKDKINRAHTGKMRIKSRLIADLDPEEWEFPPKPRWMRWKTYERHERKFDHYEEILNHGCAELIAKLPWLKIG